MKIESKAFFKDLVDGAKDGWDELSGEEQEVVERILKDIAQFHVSALSVGSDLAEEDALHIKAQVDSLGSVASKIISKSVVNTIAKYGRITALAVGRSALGLPPM